MSTWDMISESEFKFSSQISCTNKEIGFLLNQGSYAVWKSMEKRKQSMEK